MPAQMTGMTASRTEGGHAALTLTYHCPFCDEDAEVAGVDLDGFQRWLMGEFIGQALPGLTLDERELLICGCHRACFTQAHGGRR